MVSGPVLRRPKLPGLLTQLSTNCHLNPTFVEAGIVLWVPLWDLILDSVFHALSSVLSLHIALV